jgi:hypothetical protein
MIWLPNMVMKMTVCGATVAEIEPADDGCGCAAGHMCPIAVRVRRSTARTHHARACPGHDDRECVTYDGEGNVADVFLIFDVKEREICARILAAHIASE